MSARILASGALAVLVATGVAHAKGWDPAKPPFIRKGEIGATACGNKTTSDSWICLVLSCAKGTYRGGLMAEGGFMLGDAVTFTAGSKTATVPLGPVPTIPVNGVSMQPFTANAEAFAALLAEGEDIRITGAQRPPNWEGEFPLPAPGFGTFASKGAKAQLARINKACGVPAP